MKKKKERNKQDRETETIPSNLVSRKIAVYTFYALKLNGEVLT